MASDTRGSDMPLRPRAGILHAVVVAVVVGAVEWFYHGV